MIYGSANATGIPKLAAVTVSELGNDPLISEPAVPKRLIVALLFMISSNPLFSGPPIPAAAQVVPVAAKAKK
jgi:hypothetical protein